MKICLSLYVIVFQVVSQVAANPGYDLDLGTWSIFVLFSFHRSRVQDGRKCVMGMEAVQEITLAINSIVITFQERTDI